MAILEGFNLAKGLLIRGKLGRPNRLGEHYCGFTYLGDDNPYCAVYQIKHTRKGRKVSKMKHYFAENPQTLGQTHRRDIFRDGVLAWQGLPLLDQIVYNKRKYPANMSGFNRFMRDYLKSHF